MEFLEGENLAERLERGGSFARDLSGAGSILAQVASALAAAHAKGIVHRDLKPDNIFLTGAVGAGGPPAVKILDFGIAKLVVDDGEGRNKTRTGSLLGTPTYMSPEQCRGAGSIDHRTDIYALGCVAFEVVAGRPPFVRSGSGEVLVAHLVEPAPRLSSAVPGVPAELDALVAQMLEKDPAARPQTMTDVGVRVESIFGATAAVPRSASMTPSMGTAARTPAPTPAPSPGASTGSGSGRAVIAGGTRVMSAASHTTLSDSASEAGVDDDVPPLRPRRRWAVPAVVAGGVAVGAIGVALVFRTPASPPASRERPVQHEALAPTPPPPPPVRRPPAEVTIEVASQPPGAEVWLPGEDAARGKTPLKIAAHRGDAPVKLTLKATGYADASVTLDPDGEGGPVNVALEKIKREREHKHLEGGGHSKKWVGPHDQDDIYKAMGD
jgi:serine/threonine-protein kinase